MTTERVRERCAVLLLAATCGTAVAAAQTPPETFDEEVVVRETSVAALPPGSRSKVPALDAVTVRVAGIERRVTRVGPMLEGKRGEWEMVVYLDPRLAGPRTRFLTTLALGQRAESLAALGHLEVLVADAARPALARTDSWQRIEAALLNHALEAKHRLARGDRPTEAPAWDLFEDRVDLLLERLETRQGSGPRALFLPSDGLYSMVGAKELEPIARLLAGAGWVVVPMPWNEQPSEPSAARLSEFESWKEASDGRDTSAGTRRYVIDFGRVLKRLLGTADSPGAELAELEPQVVALATLAGPTSGRLASREGELQAALNNLARRWRVWFQAAETGSEGPVPLEVRLGDEPLDAPGWISSPASD